MLGAMTRPPGPLRRRRVRQAGITMIESMVTLAITAVLVGLAVPSMQELIARRRVAAVATELASDLRYLISSGLQRNMSSQLDIAGACYVLSLDPGGAGACNCTIASPCGSGALAPQILKTVSVPAGSGITLSSARANTPFNPRGLIRNGHPITVTISSTHGGSVRVYTQDVVSRPYVCSLANQEGSFPACAGP